MKYLNYTLSNKQMCEVSAGFLFLSLKIFFQEEVHLLFIFLNYQYSNNLCGLKKKNNYNISITKNCYHKSGLCKILSNTFCHIGTSGRKVTAVFITVTLTLTIHTVIRIGAFTSIVFTNVSGDAFYLN